LKTYFILSCLLVSFLFLSGCGGDEEETTSELEYGALYGTINDKETGKPISNAAVNIGGFVVSTNETGNYSLEDIEFSDEIVITVNATGYREYVNTVSLDQELKLFDVALSPVDSPSAEVLEVLELMSGDIELLDPGKIPSTQSNFSEDYVAGDSMATLAGIMAGLIPPDYESIPETINKIIEKYDKIQFKFIDPNVELKGESASIWAVFEVYAETKPPEPKKWEIAVEAKFDLQKYDNDWKVVYWELVSDFLKFEQEPL
jgi:hypothetical protein